MTMTRKFRHLRTTNATREEDDKDMPTVRVKGPSFGDLAADAAVTAVGTAAGFGTVTLIQHLVSDGASALFGGVSAGGAFSA